MIFIDFRHNTGDKLIKMMITYSWEIRKKLKNKNTQERATT